MNKGFVDTLTALKQLRNEKRNRISWDSGGSYNSFMIAWGLWVGLINKDEAYVLNLQNKRQTQ